MMFEKKRRYLILIGAAAIILLAACAPAEPADQQTPQLSAPSPAGAAQLTVMTHDSFAISEEVKEAFEQENNATVQFLKAGDAGTALNKAILSKDAPLADVFYGVDNTFLSRALEEGIFQEYQSPLLSEIPDEFELDPDHRALPVDFGDVCLNYDKNFFDEKGIAPPQNLEDLLKPEYKSSLVVQNPATSSPGLAFLLATIGHFGEGAYLDYWRGLVANDVLVVNDWELAYYTEFSRWGGTRPIVVSYGSSPPVEMIFAEEPMEQPLTAVVTGDESCFRQIEFAGILEGSQNRLLAEKWIDFMLSERFQEDIPLQMFVFPVNQSAQLNETFKDFLAVPEKPAYISPEDIARNRETWIREWTETVLR
jgi:thiamine transport system substrate-binding protein